MTLEYARRPSRASLVTLWVMFSSFSSVAAVGASDPCIGVFSIPRRNCLTVEGLLPKFVLGAKGCRWLLDLRFAGEERPAGDDPRFMVVFRIVDGGVDGFLSPSSSVIRPSISSGLS